MPIPPEILAVPRPKSTRVKLSYGRYLVIIRTSKRVNGKPKAVDLGTIGEIVDGKYVEIRPEPKKQRHHVDIKDYGEFALCNKAAGDLFQELAKVFDIKTAKQIYIIALLRACDKDIKDRDIQFAYETSFASEVYPGVPLSENTVSKMLLKVGMEYRYIRQFMQNRIMAFSGKNLIIDGMLKDCNRTTDTLSEWSRKGAKKGSMDLNMIYAYDPESQEPIAVKPYPGNMLDLTAIEDFIADFPVSSGILVMDKGFSSGAVLSKLKALEGVSYIVPLKQSSKKVKENGLLEPFASVLDGYTDATILYKKISLDNGTFLYAFRDPRCAYEQQVGYISFGKKKGTYTEDKFLSKLDQFGLIVFESKSDLEPLDVYRAYAERWEIEVMFDLYKNIIDLDTVNVQGDYRLYATEFINYISVIIDSRVKKLLAKDKLASKYSFRQVFRYLSKCKRIRVADSDKWIPNSTVKYIEQLAYSLGV